MRDYGVVTKAATTSRQPKRAVENLKQAQVQTAVQPTGASGELLRLQRQHGNRYVQGVIYQSLQTISKTGNVFIQRRGLQYYVVGDRGLDAGGGILLHQLSSIRERLRQTQEQQPWTLVISIHGSEGRICDVARPANPDRQCYDAGRIQQVFSDAQFAQWRNRYGPTRVVLNACQVSLSFERALIAAVTRAGSGQPAQGLGEGCRPDTESVSVDTELAGMRQPITRRSQYEQLTDPNKEALRNQLEQLNRRWGYFGAPPVNSDRSTLLRYYFDEVPRGAWVIVRVSVGRQVHDIPFYNRAQHSDFRRLCGQGVAPLHPHVPSAPPLQSSQ
jgi:hypothetical protein